VRAEEKELEGPELEREERTREPAAHEEEALPAFGGEVLRDLELAHRSTLFDALRLVLAGENVTISLLYLPQRETHALEALQAAVTGRDSVGEFVFAEDRRGLLEQALAVLQQNVTYGDPAQLAELHAKFDELTEQVTVLREHLVSLEDAQDDLVDEKRVFEEAAAEDSGDPDKPAGKPEDAALDGPARPEEPPPPSTLDGDAPAEEPPPPSTLDGPARPEEPPPPSELAAESAAAEAEKPRPG
jgi:hypothetical protein